jgi:hypothetical protein
MKNIKLLFNLLLFSTLLISTLGNADDLGDIGKVVQRFYSTNERTLQCRTKDEDAVDEALIRVPESLFSNEFFSIYRIICLRNDSNIYIPFDIRTGDPQMHVSNDSKVQVSKISIGKPVMNPGKAIVRITYDLDIASFKQWGNFTDLKFVNEAGRWRIDDIQLGGSGADRNSYTGLIEIKSLKKYLKDEIVKSKKAKH